MVVAGREEEEVVLWCGNGCSIREVQGGAITQV